MGTPFAFSLGTTLTAAALDAAGATKADSNNPTITGTLTLNSVAATGFGTGIGMMLGPMINFQGSGIPGVQLQNQLIFNRATPTSADGTDLFFRRDGTSVTGGTSANINKVLTLNQTVGPSDGSQNWTLNSVISTNNTSQRNAVAADFQAVRLSGNGSLFGLVVEARDQTGLSSSASGSPFGDVAVELDVTGTGLDDATNPASFGGFGIRNFIHFVADTWQGIVAPHEVAHGLWFGTSHGSYIGSVIAFDNGGGTGAQVRNVVDTRQAVAPTGVTNPVSAVTMTAGHIIDFNGPTTVAGTPRNYWWWDSATSKMKYNVGATTVFSIDNSGNVRALGTITASVAP